MPLSFRHLLANVQGKAYKRIDNRKSHGKSGKNITQFNHAHFICWDGEGISDHTRPMIEHKDEHGRIVSKVEYQNYALFMNNEGFEVSHVSGLSTELLLSSLLYASEDKRAIHCCFGASYDVNMILRDVPEKDLRLLHAGKTIDYKRYQLTYRPRKSFEVREYMTVHQKYLYNPRTKKREGWYKKSIVLWDVFSFFQKSFVETLDKWFLRGNRLPEEEKQKWKEIIARIKEGKELRGTFTEEQLHSFVAPYCKLEVDALHELMMLLHSYLLEADMKITRWDGAGACATAVLKKYNVKQHISEKDIPSAVIQAAEHAFFGGRIETLLYGNYSSDTKSILNNNDSKVYHKDISSAYPDALSQLPSLQNGEWKHEYTRKIKSIQADPLVSIYLVSWIMDFNTIIAPFPWRSRNGNVYFPPRGKAWVYGPELKMALDCFNKGKYKCKLFIHESWTYYPATDVKPFAFIPELFELRKYLLSIASGAELVIKLALNSLYGKTAQSIGYRDKEGQKPPYHNMVIAGMTTSLTRAKMMRAAMTNPQFVIMLATDGIYSIKDLDVPCSDTKELGTWECTEHEYITIVASGVYWYKSENDDETAFSRGFDKYTVMRELVLDAWKKGERKLDCATTRFVTLGSAVGLNDFSLWCSWRTVYRELGLNMDKVAKRDAVDDGDPSTHLIRTYATCPQILVEPLDIEGFPYYSNVAMSNKYKFRWDDKLNTLDSIPLREYLEEAANTLA